MNDSTIIILLLLAIGWFWWDSRGAAERAIQAVKNHCERTGVNLLNDTVAWKKIRLKRNRSGRVQIERTYFFEFASDLQQRYRGEIVMLGQQVKSVHLDAFRVWS